MAKKTTTTTFVTMLMMMIFTQRFSNGIITDGDTALWNKHSYHPQRMDYNMGCNVGNQLVYLERALDQAERNMKDCNCGGATTPIKNNPQQPAKPKHHAIIAKPKNKPAKKHSKGRVNHHHHFRKAPHHHHKISRHHHHHKIIPHHHHKTFPHHHHKTYRHHHHRFVPHHKIKKGKGGISHHKNVKGKGGVSHHKNVKGKGGKAHPKILKGKGGISHHRIEKGIRRKPVSLEKRIANLRLALSNFNDKLVFERFSKYAFVRASKTYDEAEELCKRVFGLGLANFGTKKNMANVFKFLQQKVNDNGGKRRIWIGGYASWHWWKGWKYTARWNNKNKIKGLCKKQRCGKGRNNGGWIKGQPYAKSKKYNVLAFVPLSKRSNGLSMDYKYSRHWFVCQMEK